MVFQVLFYFYASYSKVEISVNSMFVLVSLVSASYPISKSVHRSKADFSNHYQRRRKQNWSGQARCL